MKQLQTKLHRLCKMRSALSVNSLNVRKRLATLKDQPTNLLWFCIIAVLSLLLATTRSIFVFSSASSVNGHQRRLVGWMRKEKKKGFLVVSVNSVNVSKRIATLKSNKNVIFFSCAKKSLFFRSSDSKALHVFLLKRKKYISFPTKSNQNETEKKNFRQIPQLSAILKNKMWCSVQKKIDLGWKKVAEKKSNKNKK